MYSDSIEGYPFLIRFKTVGKQDPGVIINHSIEGYPFIIRFKTQNLIRVKISLMRL